MHPKLLLSSGLLFAFGLSLSAAEPAAPAPAAATETATSSAPAPAKSPIDDELQGIVSKIQAKLQSGANTPEALAPELKEFDALIASHAGDKSESAARLSFMRALLYIEVFNDYDRGGTLMQAVVKDYPGTRVAAGAERALAQIEAQKESLKIQSALKPGAAFPDFQEKDTAGQPISVAKYQGKIVLVDFWATWCPPCRAEVPNVVAAYQKYHDKGFEIIGISLDDDAKKLKDFTAENKMTWAEYFDGLKWQNKLSRKYGVNSIPASYLLDGDGKIIAKDLRGEELSAKLEELLGKTAAK